uniref:Uncharacterized protein n=1 Tax=Arundo donax TaxID=35708 RepID=A0A0A9FIY4_ARUDO
MCGSIQAELPQTEAGIGGEEP